MNSQAQRMKDGTIKINVQVPWEEVEKTKQEIEDKLAREVSAPGFRKGKLPKNIAKEKLNSEKVREQMLRTLLPKYYSQALQEQKINPIVTPRIHVEAFGDGTSLEFVAETCEEPAIKLQNYKDEIKKVTAKSKIIVPGREEKKPDMDEVVEAALQSTEIVVPNILVEQEADRLLSQLLDDLKTLGLTLDQYLASKGKTGDALRTEYEKKAEKDLKFEFMLRKIADTEHITVEQKDIDDTLNSIKDEKQKQELTKNPYFVASVIRQQKTLHFLSSI